MKNYSLSELASLIEEALSPMSDSTFWVRAEIASLTTRNGHAYFELAEKSASGMQAAKMRATCWANLYNMLSAYFAEETGQHLQAGMQILVEVEVSFHAVYGLSLNIRNIDPQFTLGDIARQKQDTIRRLQKEGVFDMQQSLSLPMLTHRIAVISARQAAGYDDFLNHIQQSAYNISVTLFPALMQGERAEQSILDALNNIMMREQDFDAVVIIRGGGAVTDLGCFDNYLLAAACAQFPLPIITGIGHTRNVSVLDMVAHTPLKTPTAVADFLINRFDRLMENIDSLRRRLKQCAEKQILVKKHRIEMLRQRLSACSPERIFNMGYSLTMAGGHVVRSIADIRHGQTITTHLKDGTVSSIAQ